MSRRSYPPAAETKTGPTPRWGGFWFEQVDDLPAGAGGMLVDDEEVGSVAGRSGPQRQDTIGARSQAYGVATVEVYRSGELAARATTDSANHVWVDGLEPDTGYTYRVLVHGKPWAEGERWDWRPGGPTPQN